jgi:hypothetical protein
VRTIDIYTLFAGVVWIVEHIRLSVGDVLPQRQIGIAGGGEGRMVRVDR